MSDDLVAWLTAQIDEDERVAKAATSDGPWCIDGMSIRGNTRMNGTDVLVVRHTWPQEAEHIVRHDPARVLRDLAAKRKILDEHEMAIWPMGGETCVVCREWPCMTVKLLAEPLADRPGYRPEWAPR